MVTIFVNCIVIGVPFYHTLAHLLLSPILPLFITVSRTLLIGIVKILFGFKEISIHNNFVYFKSWFICKNMYKFIC